MNATQRPNRPATLSRSSTMGLEVPWWCYLLTSAAWFIIAWLVLRVQASPTTTVVTISTLAGVVIMLAGFAELFNAFSAPGWRWLHAILAVVFLVTAVVVFLHPGGTFAWLAAFIGWYFLFKGMLDIMLAFATKDEYEGWWLGLVVGIIEVGLGFWAAGPYGRGVALLIVFVGAIALTKAITDIVLAFRLRKLTHGGGAVPVASMGQR